MDFEIIEVIVSTLSLLSCLLMQIVFFKHDSLWIFSYTIQFYIIFGVSLFSFLDFIYNWTVFFVKPSAQNTFICQIIAYLSVFGVLNSVTWSTFLMRVTRVAIQERQKEQLGKNLSMMAMAFLTPIILSIFPQLINNSIYGLYGDVCWLQYNTSTDKIKLTVFSLIFFFIPICSLSILQIYDYRLIYKKIQQLRLQGTQTSQPTQDQDQHYEHNNHIIAVTSISFYSIYFLTVWTLPTIFYILQLFSIEIGSYIPFQTIRVLQSLNGIIVFIIMGFNKQCSTTFIRMFTNETPSIHDAKIDLFQGLENIWE